MRHWIKETWGKDLGSQRLIWSIEPLENVIKSQHFDGYLLSVCQCYQCEQITQSNSRIIGVWIADILCKRIIEIRLGVLTIYCTNSFTLLTLWGRLTSAHHLDCIKSSFLLLFLSEYKSLFNTVDHQRISWYSFTCHFLWPISEVQIQRPQVIIGPFKFT